MRTYFFYALTFGIASALLLTGCGKADSRPQPRNNATLVFHQHDEKGRSI